MQRKDRADARHPDPPPSKGTTSTQRLVRVQVFPRSLRADPLLPSLHLSAAVPSVPPAGFQELGRGIGGS